MNTIEKFSIYAYLFGQKANVIYDYTIQIAEGEYRITQEQNDSELANPVDRILAGQSLTFKNALAWVFSELHEKETGKKLADIGGFISYATLFTKIEEACLGGGFPSITVLGKIEKYKGNERKKYEEVLSMHGYSADMKSHEPELIVLNELIESEIMYSLN